MRNCLRRYFIKSIFFTSVILILLIAVSSATLNIILLRSKSKIQQSLSEHINQKISIESARYLPPNFIIFKNASIFKDGPSGKSQFVSIKKVKLTFSLTQLISKRNFIITNIFFYKPQVNYLECTHLLKENIVHIISLVNSFNKKQEVSLAIKAGSLNLPQKDQLTTSISINAVLKIGSDWITSFGSIGLERFSAKGPKKVNMVSKTELLDYNFRGTFKKEVLFIESLELRKANFYVRLWGGFKNNSLILSGFSSLSDLYIFDVDCSINFAFPNIQLKNLSFSLDGVRLYLNGNFFFYKPPLINLTFSSPQVRATFKGLAFYFTKEQNLKIFFDEVVLAPMVKDSLFKISLEDFNILFDPGDERFKFVRFSSKIYDGFLEGRGYVGIAETPLNCAFYLKIKEVSSNKFNSLLVYFSNIYGTLNSCIYYKTHPHSNLTGEMIISDGYLDNLEFFRWLAEFFGIPSLKKLDFNKLSVGFLVKDKGVNLNKISLDSREVSLDGYFNLNEKNLISSKLSLALSRRLLKTSAKFKSLLKLLGEEFSFLSFDFQLSGLLHAMNIKWLESDFKKSIRDLIPDFMEKRIENNLEEIMESISLE